MSAFPTGTVSHLNPTTTMAIGASQPSSSSGQPNLSPFVASISNPPAPSFEDQIDTLFSNFMHDLTKAYEHPKTLPPETLIIQIRNFLNDCQLRLLIKRGFVLAIANYYSQFNPAVPAKLIQVFFNLPSEVEIRKQLLLKAATEVPKLTIPLVNSFCIDDRTILFEVALLCASAEPSTMIDHYHKFGCTSLGELEMLSDAIAQGFLVRQPDRIMTLLANLWLKNSLNLLISKVIEAIVRKEPELLLDLIRNTCPDSILSKLTGIFPFFQKRAPAYLLQVFDVLKLNPAEMELSFPVESPGACTSTEPTAEGALIPEEFRSAVKSVYKTYLRNFPTEFLDRYSTPLVWKMVELARKAPAPVKRYSKKTQSHPPFTCSVKMSRRGVVRLNIYGDPNTKFQDVGNANKKSKRGYTIWLSGDQSLRGTDAIVQRNLNNNTYSGVLIGTEIHRKLHRDIKIRYPGNDLRLGPKPQLIIYRPRNPWMIDKIEVVAKLLQGDIHEKAVPVTTVQALTNFAKLAETLQYFHENNYIHKDIKGPNIIYDADGKFYIIDFDLMDDLKNERSIFHNYFCWDHACIDGFRTPNTDVYGLVFVLTSYFLPEFTSVSKWTTTEHKESLKILFSNPISFFVKCLHRDHLLRPMIYGWQLKGLSADEIVHRLEQGHQLQWKIFSMMKREFENSEKLFELIRSDRSIRIKDRWETLVAELKLTTAKMLMDEINEIIRTH